MLITPNRRSVLLGLSSVFAWSFIPKAGYARAKDPRFLVVILRGGLDGLAAVPPIGDPSYADVRSKFGLSAGEATFPINDLFAFNANMPELNGLYRKGQAAVFHAVATPYRGRSHFDGQDMLEGGLPALSGPANSGWLNRALEQVPRGERLPVPKGLAISPTVPVIMRGRAPVSTWQPQVFRYADSETIARLLDLYELRDPALAQSLREGADIDTHMMGNEPKGGAVAGYPDFTGAASAAARLMAEPNGPRIAAVGFNGWDTHAQEGPNKGHLAKNLTSLDRAFRAFADGLGPVWNETVVLVITEFGRTVAINGTMGTDHGTGTVAFLLGGAVKGGRILADWPGLARHQLHDGRDLAPTTDLRAIVKGVMTEHLAIDAGVLAQSVFPDSEKVKPIQGLIA